MPTNSQIAHARQYVRGLTDPREKGYAEQYLEYRTLHRTQPPRDALLPNDVKRLIKKDVDDHLRS